MSEEEIIKIIKNETSYLCEEKDEAIQGLLDLYQQEKEKNRKVLEYCKRDLAFEKSLIKRQIMPDVFNQGRFYTCQNIIEILEEE